MRRVLRDLTVNLSDRPYVVCPFLSSFLSAMMARPQTPTRVEASIHFRRSRAWAVPIEWLPRSEPPRTLSCAGSPKVSAVIRRPCAPR